MTVTEEISPNSTRLSVDDVLLEVNGLRVDFATAEGVVHAVGGVSYSVGKGETVAIVGESGSGKSVSVQAIMGTLASPPGRIVAGSVHFAGRDVLLLPERERRQLRGRHMAMVFQDSLAALNPAFSVGEQIAEMYRTHLGLRRGVAKRRAIEMMTRVGIPDAARRSADYPHQFSGGMRQRVVIAMAIALEPELLIADEPTTALDVTIQAQIMELLLELREELAMGLILITHDLGVVAETSDRVIVMYAGKIVESGRSLDVFARPAHPYTEGLLRSTLRVDRGRQALTPIRGNPPHLGRLPAGCSFHPRCPYATSICSSLEPELQTFADRRASACHFWKDLVHASD